MFIVQKQSVLNETLEANIDAFKEYLAILIILLGLAFAAITGLLILNFKKSHTER